MKAFSIFCVSSLIVTLGLNRNVLATGRNLLCKNAGFQYCGSWGRTELLQSIKHPNTLMRAKQKVNLDEFGVPAEILKAPRPIRGHVAGGRKTRKQGGSKPRRRHNQGKALAEGMTNPSRLRIMGGVSRGMRLDSPEVYLRPMMGKVKEALFSSLEYMGVFESGSAKVLDLFSGSGSVGLEALSRGAAEAVFVDFAPECTEVCLKNAKWCGFEGRASTVTASVLDALAVDGPLKGQLFDLVTITPPYEEVVYSELIDGIVESQLLADDCVVAIEYPIEMGSLPHLLADSRLVGLRNKRYGRTMIGMFIYRPTGRLLAAAPKIEEFPPFRK